MNGKEIAVAYFRTGYVPQNYPEEAFYEGRLLLEKSAAIKCPNIDLQLVTFKKIQEALSSDVNWGEVVGEDEANYEEIGGLFKGMFGFEDIEGVREVINDAKKNPGNYVLKTQGEGGGNNYFGPSIPPMLELEDELWQYSLMKRVFPQSFNAQLMRNGEIWEGESVSELGVFGDILWAKDGTLLQNAEIGCMMRTKPIFNDEGGVMAGYAYVDTPYRFEGTKEEFRLGNKFKLS